MVELFKVLIRHDEDDDCQGHCVIHDLDEPGPGYLRCGECGHLYASERDLRRAYRKMSWEIWAGFSRPLLFSTNFKPSLVRRLWRLLFFRTDSIYWCMECAHNF